LEKWGGWKDVYSLYLKVSEKKKSASEGGPTDANAEIPRKKKRSRWGAKTEEGKGEDDNGGEQKRGRSR